MKSVVFNAGSESYQVANVVYAGAVSEIPEDKRRNGSTHSFKMITTQGAVYCYYKSFEAAKNARSALGAMMSTLKPNVFRHGNQIIDPARVVSFRSVLALKKAQNGHTHAVVVTVDTIDPKSSTVWLLYKSEENAEKGRKALYAATHGRVAPAAAAREETKAEGAAVAEPVAAVAENPLPF